MADYVIEHTQPTVYTDNKGSAVSGVLVTVTFPEFDETHEIRVPKMDKALIQKAAEDLLEQRRAISELGG